VVEDGSGDIEHGRLEIERRKQQSHRALRADAGRRGGDAKARALRAQRIVDARARGTHTEQEWAGLLAACGDKCVKCGGVDGGIHKDHIEPVYRGGSDAIENLQPLCRTCNTAKGPDSTDYRPDWILAMLASTASKPLPKASSPSASASATTLNKEKTLALARFERFWMVYPRKVGKAGAEKAWLKLKADDELTDRLIASVVAQTPGWDDPKFIPHASTWLNGRRWEDAATARPVRINGIEQQPEYRGDYECRHVPPCSSARIHQNALDMGRLEA
jgi:5-methylcytosine-specific restriction endonuclease McrA